MKSKFCSCLGDAQGKPTYLDLHFNSAVVISCASRRESRISNQMSRRTALRSAYGLTAVTVTGLGLANLRTHRYFQRRHALQYPHAR